MAPSHRHANLKGFFNPSRQAGMRAGAGAKQSAKNDRNDAEAISEAASRPSMRSVANKTIDQQADGIILKHREMLISQRTQAINALRGHAAEFGVVVAKGTCKVAALLAALAADNAIPLAARAMFEQMGGHIETLDQRVAAVE